MKIKMQDWIERGTITIKKNKAKRRTIYCGGRVNKMATQAIPPPTPVATFGPRPGFVVRGGGD